MRTWFLLTLILPCLRLSADTVDYWYLEYKGLILFADNKSDDYSADSVFQLDLSKFQYTDTVYLVRGGCRNFASDSEQHRLEIFTPDLKTIVKIDINKKIGECRFPLSLDAFRNLQLNKTYILDYAHFNKHAVAWVSCLPPTRFAVKKRVNTSRNITVEVTDMVGNRQWNYRLWVMNERGDTVFTRYNGNKDSINLDVPILHTYTIFMKAPNAFIVAKTVVDILNIDTSKVLDYWRVFKMEEEYFEKETICRNSINHTFSKNKHELSKQESEKFIEYINSTFIFKTLNKYTENAFEYQITATRCFNEKKNIARTRAESVKKILIEKGVKSENVKIYIDDCHDKEDPHGSVSLTSKIISYQRIE